MASSGPTRVVPDLVVVQSNGSERREPIEAEVSIGRDPSNPICLDDGYLSRRHCKFVRRGERVSVVDLRSYNGTFVNGQKVQDECFLSKGDVVRIGRTTLYVDWKDATEASDGVRVHANDQKVAREGVEPIVRTAKPAISATYRAVAESVPFGPSSSQPLARSDPEARTLSYRREDLREKKTPVPLPAIEDSAASRTGGDASSASRAGPSRERDGLRVIGQIARVLPAVDDESEFLDYCIGKLLEVVPAERGVLMRLDPSRRGLYPASVRNALPGRDDQTARKQGISHTIAKKVIREKVSVLIDDARIDPRFKGSSSIQDLEVRSILAAPIWLGEEVSGLVYLDHLMHSHVFTEADRELLVAVANLVALGLAKSRRKL